MKGDDEINRIQPVILAAGEGKRFRASGMNCSKIMAKIGSRTIIERQLERVSGFLKPIVVVRKEDEEGFKTLIKERAVVTIDESPQNPATSLKKTIRFIDQSAKHTLVLLGDTLCKSNKTINCAKTLSIGVNNGMIGVTPLTGGNKGSSVVAFEQGRLIKVKCPTDSGGWRWAGIAVLPKEWLSDLSEKKNLIDQIGELAKWGRLIRVVIEDGICLNINTVQELKLAEELF